METENFSGIEILSLNTLLSKLNYRPIFQSQNETIYRNILQINSGKSNFKVNNDLNYWYDTFTGASGNINDFIRLFWPGLTGEQISAQLRYLFYSRSTTQQPNPQKKKRNRKPIKVPNYQIQTIKPLGKNYCIREFLEQEGIWQYADMYLKEIKYYSVDPKGIQKNFTAVGWQNENYGWEIMARNFRDCIGTQGMTFRQRSNNTLLLFNDYPDYLKAQIHRKIPHASVLIVNQIKFKEAAENRAKHFKNVVSFLQKDE